MMENEFLSDRVNRITHSATLEINERVKILRSQGKDIIDFGLGEANYPTPTNVLEKLHKVEEGKYSRYTETAGTPELRKSISQALKDSFSIDDFNCKMDYNENEIIVSTGSKHLIYSAMEALCNPTDEVVLHAPYWVSYIDMAKLAGTQINVINTDENTEFQLKPDVLEDSLTDNSKLLLLNTPNNPTGAMLSKKNLKGIVDVVMNHDRLFVLSDEIYSLLTYGDEHHSISAMGDEDFLNRCIITSGLSKAYSMGGWRIGYALMKNRPLYDAMVKIASNTISSPPSITQDASVDAFQAFQQVKEMKTDFSKRREYIVKRFREIGLDFVEPKGAFYIFPNISKYIGKSYDGKMINGSKDFSLSLLNEGVSSVAGSAFGNDNNVRFSYVAPYDKLEDGCSRIEKFLNKLN